MRLCMKRGNGVCLNCPRRLAMGYGGICRYRAEELLDSLTAIIETKWTQEQAEIFENFEITKDNTK